MNGSGESILSKKLNLFKRMKELAERQEDFLLKDRLDSFMSLIAQRNQIQRKIQKQDELADEIYRGPESAPFREKSGRINLQISDVITSIQETDRKIEEMIFQQKTRLIREIKELRHGKKAVKGYRGKSGYTPRYIDHHR